MSDANASRRIRPGAPGKQGQCFKVDFTVSTTAATELPLRVQAANTGVSEQWVDIYTTADCHLVVGKSDVPAATNNDVIFRESMGWVSCLLLAGDTHVRVKGDSGSGTLYIWHSGD